MEINRRQRQVLIGCGGAVIAMLLYPPLQFRGVGRGYGWIFSTKSDLAINTSQLLVQWLAVGIVGAIAFVLVSGELPAASTIPRPRLRQVLNMAFKASRTWGWILFAAAIVPLLFVFAGMTHPSRVVGNIVAAPFLYACVFLWNCWIARKGEGQVAAERAKWRKRLFIIVVAGLVVIAAVIAWEAIGDQTTGRVLLSDEEVGLVVRPAK